MVRAPKDHAARDAARQEAGADGSILYRLVDVLVDQMGEAYPELRTGRHSIVQIVHGEEERFDAVLNRGLPKLEEAIGLAAERTGIIPGDQAFHFSDTSGLPRDYIEDLASERGVRVDGEGFERALEVQRGKSRKSQAFEGKQGREVEYTSDEARRELFETGDFFEGYATTRVAGVSILALFDEQQRQISTLQAGESGYVMIERTPFYQEAGGQVSDSGRISADAGSGEADVEGMARLGFSVPRAHRVRVISGSLNVRDLVTAGGRRAASRRHAP